MSSLIGGDGVTNDFWLGCTYTLACIFAGILIALIFVAVLGDRGDPGEFFDDKPPIGPTPEELEAWLTENTTVEFFEADLLPRGRGR
jgi:hypothetical protein